MDNRCPFAWRFPSSPTASSKRFWGALDTYASPVECLKVQLCLRELQMLPGAPSPSPVHSGSIRKADTSSHLIFYVRAQFRVRGWKQALQPWHHMTVSPKRPIWCFCRTPFEKHDRRCRWYSRNVFGSNLCWLCSCTRKVFWHMSSIALYVLKFKNHIYKFFELK
jgi:hypothetical protein